MMLGYVSRISSCSLVSFGTQVSYISDHTDHSGHYPSASPVVKV